LAGLTIALVGASAKNTPLAGSDVRRTSPRSLHLKLEQYPVGLEEVTF
jgi:hypothetical protein